MLKIGLTGNMGVGKTTITKIFSSLNQPVVLADVLAREAVLLDPVKKKIKESFGRQVFLDNHTLDRKRLAELVFEDPKQLAALNTILHPLIWDLFLKKCAHYKNAPYVIFEAAIIFEAGYQQNLDKIITVAAPEKIAIDRIVKRDNMSTQEAQSRLENQYSQSRKMDMADFIIVNDGQSLLIPQVLKIHRELLEMSSKR